MDIVKLSSLKNLAEFRDRLAELGADLPLDDVIETGDDAPLARPLQWNGHTVGNRFCILPMEGWDGLRDGRPSELTHRRWTNFGISGAKLIWGGEAIAVRPDGRANPNQLLLNDKNLPALEELRLALVQAHEERFGSSSDLLIGLQLTHSGRYSRPTDSARPEPRIAYRHPWLDHRVAITDDAAVLTDDELKRLTDDFIKASVLASRAGFAFVDIKHCHGYLGHELLSAFNRPGIYGGSLENRTRFLREIIAGIRGTAPQLQVGVRLSIFDFGPFQKDANGDGIPETLGAYPFAFGGDGTGTGIDLREPSQVLRQLEALGIRLVCTTAGSPYYNPHIQRPAFYPPCDGYRPPEDPLLGVARQIAATAQLKAMHSNLMVVGSGYSYLQEWLPHVAQCVVRNGMADFVGLGRIALAYPEFPADVLAGRRLVRNRICRTFSDCTSAPRNGMVSGCYPLDPFYQQRPERQRLPPRM